MSALKVWIAVNGYGQGFVIGWEGDKTDGDERTLSTYQAFSEEVNGLSHLTEDLGIGHPEEPGVYLFTGKMTWNPVRSWRDPYAEAEPIYDGNFECLMALPHLDMGEEEVEEEIRQ